MLGYPASNLDGVLFDGLTAEMHMEKEVTEAQLASSRARFYRQPDFDVKRGRVALILGAGNVNSIPPTDCITSLQARRDRRDPYYGLRQDP